MSSKSSRETSYSPKGRAACKRGASIRCVLVSSVITGLIACFGAGTVYSSTSTAAAVSSRDANGDILSAMLTVDEARSLSESKDISLHDERCDLLLIECERRFKYDSYGTNLQRVQVNRAVDAAALKALVNVQTGPVDQYQLRQLDQLNTVPGEQVILYEQPISPGWRTVWGQRTGENYLVQVMCWGHESSSSTDQMVSCVGDALDYQFTKLIGQKQPLLPPRQVEDVNVVLDGSIAFVTWSTPVLDDRRPISSYTVTSGSRTLCEIQTAVGLETCVVPDLAKGQELSVQVTAGNRAGKGPPSAAVLAKRSTTRPSRPRAVRVSRDGGRIDVRWKRPLDDGGEAIDSYVVRALPSGAVCRTTKTKCTFASLDPGRSYRFTVFAATDKGVSKGGRSKAISLPLVNKPDVFKPPQQFS